MFTYHPPHLRDIRSSLVLNHTNYHLTLVNGHNPLFCLHMSIELKYFFFFYDRCKPKYTEYQLWIHESFFIIHYSNTKFYGISVFSTSCKKSI